MANEAFKAYSKAKRVKLYQVAAELGIRPAEFSIQYMRHELTTPESDRLLAIVDAIARRQEDEKAV